MTQLLTANFFENPYPCYEALRENGPVHWSEEFCGGAWLLTDYEDVSYALSSPNFSCLRAGGWANSGDQGTGNQLRRFKKIFCRSLLFLDGRQHARLRKATNAAFKPALVRLLRPMITDAVEALINKMETDEQTDFVESFARQLPTTIITRMLGVPESDRARFYQWSEQLARFIGAPTPSLEFALEAQDGLLSLADYFQELIAEKRERPAEDLVSALIAAEAQGQVLTTKELLAQCCTLLFAGYETTRNLLGVGLYTFLRNPRQWKLLQEVPSLMYPAIKELLRYDSPVQYTGRRVRHEVNLHGKTLRRGDLVIPLIGAANRDPKKFRDPERFDIQRNDGCHLSFGHGSHVCIGAALTYLETEIAFSALIRHFPNIRLVEDKPRWSKNAVYRSLSSLTIAVQDECHLVPA
ncbi:MAG TPA: cytochrome P450 [Noviherbaspirillum sp.]|nr:cytochrome P450 [Noviherbaspirillum sp.]